ncbi:MAG: tRNA (N(6)-L-threonylcarbamoyladenosine(37)-C(2))-methylthiotransferase MtaB [Bacilli bacterium]
MVKMMRISYYSLGCKVNLYECEAIIQQFVKNGFELVNFHEIADVVLINTCSITEVSDAKSRKIIRQATRISPYAIVAVMGCYAQLNPEEIKKIPGVDLLIGTQYRHQVYDMVMELLKNRHFMMKIDEISHLKIYEELKVLRYTNKTRGFVKIEDGCDNFCSYCTIPYARGRVRSRQPHDVIDEIRTLSDEGMKEIVLTGINTGCYGRDLDHYSFVQLLNDLIEQVPSLGRLRISSIELTEITDELLDLIKRYPNHFCMHLHIPLQGGIDSTLERMNRKYRIIDFEERLKNIRTLFPMINITTDIMIGFNGESDEDFLETCNNIFRLGFGEMHVFPYSRRPLTKAYHFPDIISEVVKKDRVKQMLAINQMMGLAYRMQFKGKIVSLLVEKNDNGILFGHTSNYIEVEVKGNLSPNTEVDVVLTDPGYPISKGVIHEF